MGLNLLLSTLILAFMILFGHRLSRRGDSDLIAVQSSHIKDTSRFGGVAIICGICSLLYIKMWSDVSVLILLSAVPIFIAGLLEDITGRISPSNRLLAAFGSAGLAVYLTGEHINAGDFWLLDRFFIIPFVAIPITLLVSSGIANSFNIIDGVNGFSAGVALIIALVLGHICQIYGETNLSYFCFMIAVATIPFLIANFPFGFIFLGDAGAYTLGHLLSWVAIVLISKHPEISAWAMLLLFFWPATEVLLSIYRRFMSKTPSGSPDSFHFHQLIMQFLQLRFGNTGGIGKWANPLSTLILMPFAVIPIIVSFYVLHSNSIAISIYLILAVSYLRIYILLIRNVKSAALDLGRGDVVERLNYIFTPIKKK